MAETVETIAAPPVSRARATLAAGACDCHMHVFGPFDRFALAAPSNYPLPDAPAALQRAAFTKVGFDRAVLIQPSPFATDNSCLLDALAQGEGRLRGVGSCGTDASEDDLADMKAACIDALRFVEMRNPAGGGRYSGTQGVDTMTRLAPAMRAARMHAQIWASPDDCANAAELAEQSGLTLVCDHLAGLSHADQPGTPAFETVLTMLERDNVWIKLTYLRKSGRPRDYSDMRPLVEQLAQARPDRLLWGSDWPFVRMDGAEPDSAVLVDQLQEWLGQELFNRIMCENPLQLFEFAQ